MPGIDQRARGQLHTMSYMIPVAMHEIETTEKPENGGKAEEGAVGNAGTPAPALQKNKGSPRMEPIREERGRIQVNRHGTEKGAHRSEKTSHRPCHRLFLEWSVPSHANSQECHCPMMALARLHENPCKAVFCHKRGMKGAAINPAMQPPRLETIWNDIMVEIDRQAMVNPLSMIA